MKGVIFKYQDLASNTEKSTFVKCGSWIEFGQKMRDCYGDDFKYGVNKDMSGVVHIDSVIYRCDFTVINEVVK